MTDDEAILMVGAEIDRQQARTRAQRIIDAAKHEYTRWRCRKRGIPVNSEQCKDVMQRAESVMARQHESTARPKLLGALLGWSASRGQMMLAEDMEIRPPYPHSLPEDDGDIPA
jgi:hypothetical protein